MPPSSIPELQSFGVSPTKGFLSPQAPLTAFKGSYFEPWDTLVGQLPALLSKGQLRDAVHALPILDATKLSSEMEYRRAYVALGFSVHAYVWSNPGDGKPAELVPPQLAEPFLAICECLGMQPVLSYAGLCLWNWVAHDGATCAEGDFFALEQLHCIGSFTGRRGEDCFNLVSVLIEAEGGTVAQLLLDALRAAKRGDAVFVIQSLNNSAERLETMGSHLFKLFDTLDADEFFHKIRPWLSGGKGMEDKGLPDGMIFQKDDGTLQAVKCVGGNAAQSALFPLLDCILGVKHETPTDGALSIFQEMRAYMPGWHRKLLTEMARVAPLRAFVDANPTNEGLLSAYNNVLDKLRSWRGKHIAIVSKYIIRPALAAQKYGESAVDGIGLEQTLGDDADGFKATTGRSLKGTGGTEIIPFLIQARDETVGIWRN